VRLDTGNRSFFGLLGIAFGAYVLVGMAACVLLALLGYRVSVDGLGALTAGGKNLWPAVAFLALVAVGAALGVWSVRKQLAWTVRLRRRVRAMTLPAPPKLVASAQRVRLGARVRLVDAEEAFSFTYGAFTPRVAVSRGLVDSVSDDELDAVLEHERYHVLNLDPLKVVIARALSPAFFYIPALRDLRRRYIAGRELAADRRAVAAYGRRPLAGALFKVIRGPGGWRELGVAAAIGGPELLDVRVAQLESGSEPRVDPVSTQSALLSGMGVAVLLAAFVVTVTSFGGLSAVLRTTMPDMELSAGAVLACIACAAPLVGAGWAGYRCLSWRARREVAAGP